MIYAFHMGVVIMGIDDYEIENDESNDDSDLNYLGLNIYEKIQILKLESLLENKYIISPDKIKGGILIPKPNKKI